MERLEIVRRLKLLLEKLEDPELSRQGYIDVLERIECLSLDAQSDLAESY